MIGIYKIVSPVGRIYIGQSKNIEKRFRWYKTCNTSKQPRLHRSFNKYGIENHKFEVICECDLEDLDFFEQFYIFEFKTFNTKNGLNLRDGGKSYLQSDEVKRKISRNRKGRIISEQGRLNMSMAQIGKKRPQWVKDKISASHKGKVRSAEHQANQVIALKNSPIVQAKIKMMQEKRQRKVLDTATNEVYPSIKKAAEANGFRSQTLRNMLAGNRKNWSTLIYL